MKLEMKKSSGWPSRCRDLASDETVQVLPFTLGLLQTQQCEGGRTMGQRKVDWLQPTDLEKRLFEFALRIVRLCQKLNEKGGVARGISYQLLRSGTSMGANYEEAQGAQSRADFIAKCSIVLKEARETRYCLRLIVASGIVPDHLLRDLTDESSQLTRIMGALVKKTRRNTLPPPTV
jgi:four helix bundle protein